MEQDQRPFIGANLLEAKELEFYKQYGWKGLMYEKQDVLFGSKFVDDNWDNFQELDRLTGGLMWQAFESGRQQGREEIRDQLESLVGKNGKMCPDDCGYDDLMGLLSTLSTPE